MPKTFGKAGSSREKSTMFFTKKNDPNRSISRNGGPFFFPYITSKKGV
jgi:hypothetical protein